MEEEKNYKITIKGFKQSGRLIPKIDAEVIKKDDNSCREKNTSQMLEP